MPEFTARNLAIALLAAATIPAVLAATVLLAQQNDNAPIRIIPPSGTSATVTGSPSVPAQAPSGGLIDLNLASAGLLDTLPGIGPALAAAIIEYRENIGPFQSIAEIQQVPKIGPVTYQEIKDLVTVSGDQ